MGLSGSGINEENHIVNGSWIAWLIDDSIGAILSVPFCPLLFCPRTFQRYEIFNAILLEITISRKTHEKFIDTNRNP